MEKISHFFELTRLKKPIGYMLLFWPCVWGLTVAYDFSNNIQIYLKYFFLFLSGSILMRSAGCIINDIADKDFDKRVELERVNQRNKEAVINENLKKWKKIFFNTFMIPIIQDFMKIYEASIVIDIDSNAFKLVIFDSRINITDGVIKRMNNLYKNIDELTLKITS